MDTGDINFGQKVILAVLGAFGVVITALLGLVGVRQKNKVDAGTAANAAAVDMINEMQEERRLFREERNAFHLERRTWEVERTDYRVRQLQCESRQRGLEQHIRSLEDNLRRQGMDIPANREVQPIILLDSNQLSLPGEP